MKLLYLSEFFFEVNGAHQLSMMHYEVLKEIIGYKNTIVVALTGGEDVVDEKYIKYKAYSSKAEKLRNLIQLNNPRINNKIINNINNIIKNEKVDIVFIDNSTYGRLARSIKRLNKNIKIISFYHDVKRNLYKQWLMEKGIKFIPDYISGIYNEYLNQKYSDYNITLNKRENNLFKKYYKKESSMQLPIIIEDKDLSYEYDGKLNNKLEPESINLLFVGAYYYPNVAGIKWFIDNVMCRISDKFVLNIIGRDMEKMRSCVNDKRVNVVGSVDSLDRYYFEADIVIAPIFDGAGMKVKTAEAFSYGKMFIGTEESLEGYIENIPETVLNKYIFRCNNELEFINVLNSIAKRKINKYEKEVSDIYIENYSKEAAIRKISEILR